MPGSGCKKRKVAASRLAGFHGTCATDAGAQTGSNLALQVSVVQQNPRRLLLLASLAEKFLSMGDDIAEEAKKIIQAHNRKYNQEETDEDYLYNDQQQQPYSVRLFVLHALEA